MPERATVQPPLRFIPSRWSLRMFRLVAAIYPLYVRFGPNVRRFDVEGIETLVEQYRRFQAKKVRLIIAFRHPHRDDGALMAWLLGGVVRKAARGGKGRRLPHRPFAHFVYDRGAPLWAGRFIGWLLPYMGGVSVFRGKMDSQGIAAIRRLLLDADQPLAIAPEGAVSYSERYAAPLETGIAHFAFWGVRDLITAGRSEEVVVLPVVPSYRHGRDAEKGVTRIAAALERECGLPPAAGKPVAERLRLTAAALFEMTERFYRSFYATTSCAIAKPEEGLAPNPDGCPGDHFTAANPRRVAAIVEAALRSAEHRLGLPSNGEPIPRIRKIEQACWDRIYRDDISDISSLSPLERALADRMALETSLTMRHLQLADILVYLNELAVPDNASLDELAEASSNLADLASRLTGGDISANPRIGSRRVTYRIGSPISVSSRWQAYLEGRAGAVDGLMRSLREEFHRLSCPV